MQLLAAARVAYNVLLVPNVRLHSASSLEGVVCTLQSPVTTGTYVPRTLAAQALDASSLPLFATMKILALLTVVLMPLDFAISRPMRVMTVFLVPLILAILPVELALTHPPMPLAVTTILARYGLAIQRLDASTKTSPALLPTTNVQVLLVFLSLDVLMFQSSAVLISPMTNNLAQLPDAMLLLEIAH